MRKQGFTLVELVLVIAFMGILAITLGPGVTAATKGYNIVSIRRQMLEEARSAMDRMVMETRLIPSSAQVVSIGANSFGFQYPTGTSITYSLSGTNLMRNSDVMASNVTSLAFTYYTALGVVTAVTGNVCIVGIKFTVQASGVPSYTLSTKVFLRNTGNNYSNYTSP